MPHFIIDCSENIISQKSPNDIMQKVYDTAGSTQLFDKGDIKVRINPFRTNLTAFRTKRITVHTSYLYSS